MTRTTRMCTRTKRHTAARRFRIQPQRRPSSSYTALIGILCLSPVAAFVPPSSSNHHHHIGCCTRLYSDSSQQQQQQQRRRRRGPFSQLATTLPTWPSSPNNNKNNNNGTTITDWRNTMPQMSTFGLFFFFIFILFVLSSNEPVTVSSNSQGFEIAASSVESAGRNVLKAALPSTASDVVSVALGEGIAGVLGALATLVLSFPLQRFRASPAAAAGGGPTVVRQALADGDYFVTRAAALPLLEAMGLSPLAASVSSVILASVPYEVIKQLDGSRRVAFQRTENALMEELLQEELRKQQQRPSLFRKIQQGQQEIISVDPKSLIPAIQTISEAPPPLDVVELFTDITKWLEYDVLKSDLSGRLLWNGQVLASNVDSALFGFVAALSSQLYADIAYTFTEYGTEEKRREARQRSLAGWIQLYVRISLNSAVLFGVYESVKTPVSTAIAGFLSRGVENCVGSDDYNTCMDAYMKMNPPEADAAAQLRSLLTAFVSLSDRLSNDGSMDRAEFTRSVVVQLYSLAQHIFSFSLFTSNDVVNVQAGEFISL